MLCATFITTLKNEDGASHNFYLFRKRQMVIAPARISGWRYYHLTLTHKKGGVHTERPLLGVLRWQGYADFIAGKEKGLFSHENKPFSYPLVEISGIEPLTS